MYRSKAGYLNSIWWSKGWARKQREDYIDAGKWNWGAKKWNSIA
jgi:hypothetical protein